MDINNIEFIWILITIITSLSSGIIGVVISIVYHKKAEKQRSKNETLKNLVGYRFHIQGEKFSKTLNEIFIVFQDSKIVIEKLNKLHAVINIKSDNKDLVNEALLNLFKAMCEDIDIDFSKNNDSLFLKAFNIKE